MALLTPDFDKGPVSAARGYKTVGTEKARRFS
jgi:hypothetical protein